MHATNYVSWITNAYLKILWHQKLHDVTPVGAQRTLVPLAEVGLHHPAVVEHPHELLRPYLPPLHLKRNGTKTYITVNNTPF